MVAARRELETAGGFDKSVFGFVGKSRKRFNVFGAHVGVRREVFRFREAFFLSFPRFLYALARRFRLSHGALCLA
ncbi:hypothetical protein D3C83_254720 [compost metagenome]